MDCLIVIVEFINTSAYTNIVLSGKNFCEAGKDGFNLKYSNTTRKIKCNEELGVLISTTITLFVALLTTTIFYCLILLVPDIRVNVI
jgi:hypothetical protein